MTKETEMNVTIERPFLLKALSLIVNTVKRRNTIPVLSNILLIAEGDTVQLTATDLDLMVDFTVSAAVATPGRTTVSAHTLFDIVRKLSEGSQVKLEQSPGKLSVTASRYKSSLPTLPWDDFPRIVAGGYDAQFEIDAAVLRRMIDTVRFAISTEETRYYLNGVFLHASGERLIAATADGHRLAKIAVALPDGASALSDVIVPRKAVIELRKLIDGLDGPVAISASPTKLSFEVEGAGAQAVLVTKAIDGVFPDYTRVIPTGNDKTATCEAAELRDVVERVAILSSEKTRQAAFNFADDVLTIEMRSPDSGEASEQLPIEYVGAPLRLGCNTKYLCDVLTLFGGGSVKIALGSDTAPMLFTGADTDAAQIALVLMPCRI